MNKAFTFESFILGKSNEAAVRKSKEFISGKVKSPIFLIYGEIGNGKTHLALACANALEEAGKKVLCKSALGMSSAVYNSFFRGKKNLFEEVLPQYESYDALIIDDLRGISGTEIMQQFFYELIQKYMMSGKKVILTLDMKDYKDYFVKKLTVLFPEIYAVKILKPDRELLMDVLQMKENVSEVRLSDVTKEYLCEQAKTVEEICELFEKGLLLHKCIGQEMNADLFYAVLEE